MKIFIKKTVIGQGLALRCHLLVGCLLCILVQIGSAQNWQQIGQFNTGPGPFLDDTLTGLLYMSGYFKYNGKDTMDGFCSWDGQTFTALGKGRSDCGNQSCGSTDFLKRIGDDIYISSPGLDSINGIKTSGVARWDGKQWSAGLPGLYGDQYEGPFLDDGCFHDGKLYGVGAFLSAGADTCYSVAYWDGQKWTGLGFKGWWPDNDVPRISSALFYKNELYVGGNFMFELEGKMNNDIARFDGAQWRRLGDGLQGGWADVWDMEEYKGELYVCGYFRSIDGNAGNKIMRWNGEHWNDVGGSICSAGATVCDMMVYQDKLVIAGIFECVGYGIPAQNIAAWDGTRWCSFGKSTFDNRITDLTAYKGDLYIGGGFIEVDGQPVKYFAKWIGDHTTDTCSAAISPATEPLANHRTILNITPNPAGNQVTITLSNPSLTGLLRFTNALGAVLREVPISGSRISISVAELPAGVYVVQHIEEGTVRAVERMVVQQ